MPRKQISNPATLARKLTGGKPMAYRLREDGSLAVIDASGAKRYFTATEVRKVADEMKKEGS